MCPVSVLVSNGVTYLFSVVSCSFCVDVDLVVVDGCGDELLEKWSHLDDEARGDHVLAKYRMADHQLVKFLHLLQSTFMYLPQLNRM